MGERGGEVDEEAWRGDREWVFHSGEGLKTFVGGL